MKRPEISTPVVGAVDMAGRLVNDIANTYASVASLDGLLKDIGEEDIAAELLSMRKELSGMLTKANGIAIEIDRGRKNDQKD